jgi:hypothetical protein
MIDLTEKVKGIRFDRERQFALKFFDHDKWVHEPRFFYMSDGSKYKPDFYDARRDTYIEVVGSRQAYSQNKCKYDLLIEQRPDIKLEFRSPDGELLCSENGRSFHKKARKKSVRKATLKNMDGASNIQKIIDGRNLSIEKAAEMCGLPESTVRSHYYGLRKGMYMRIALKYVQGLGVSVEEIMEGRA